MAVWATTLKTNFILADLYDLLAVINANLISLGSKKRAKKPKGYPRPLEMTKKKNVGKGSAMKQADLHDWIEKRRRNYERCH